MELSSIFSNKFQISTNYENVILNFVVLYIALARQGTSASRIKKSYKVHFSAERKRLFPEPTKTGISENMLNYLALCREVLT